MKYHENTIYGRTWGCNGLPIEYDVEWYSFAKALTSRSIPFKSSYIDVGFSKFKTDQIFISGYYKIYSIWMKKQKLAQAYRKQKKHSLKIHQYHVSTQK